MLLQLLEGQLSPPLTCGSVPLNATQFCTSVNPQDDISVCDISEKCLMILLEVPLRPHI